MKKFILRTIIIILTVSLTLSQAVGCDLVNNLILDGEITQLVNNFLSGGEDIQNDGISVQSVKGNVLIARGSQLLDAASGMTLNDGDILRTYANSSARLRINPDKSIEVGENTELILVNRNAGYAWKLEAGEIMVDIDKPMEDGETFTVAVGNVRALVRGTTLKITKEIYEQQVENYEQRSNQLSKFIRDIEMILSTLETVKTPASAALVAKFKQLLDTVKTAHKIVIAQIETIKGHVIILDENDKEIANLTDGQNIIFELDDETSELIKESIIIYDASPLEPDSISTLTPEPAPSDTPMPLPELTPTPTPLPELTPTPTPPTEPAPTPEPTPTPVVPVITITQQPNDWTLIPERIESGVNVFVNASVTPAATLSYQWFINGSPVPGATAAQVNLVWDFKFGVLYYYHVEISAPGAVTVRSYDATIIISNN